MSHKKPRPQGRRGAFSGLVARYFQPVGTRITAPYAAAPLAASVTGTNKMAPGI